MNAVHSKPRRALLLGLFLIGLLVPLSLLWLPGGLGWLAFKTGQREHVHGPKPVRSITITKTSSSTKRPILSTNSWAAFDAPILPVEDPNDDHLYTFSIPRPAQATLVYAEGSRFTGFGVVDLERLLAAHPAKANSPEAKAKVLQRILYAVAARANARRLGFIFDSSAQSPNNTPWIFYADETIDLTEEVLHALAAH